MSAVSPTVSKWIQRLLADVSEDGLPNRIELIHTIDGHDGDTCQIFPLEGGSVDKDMLAEEIWAVAEHDASIRPSGVPNRYVLRAFMLDDDAKPVATHPFVIRGKQGVAALGDASDSPTERGERGMFMRHTEALTRVAVNTVKESYDRVVTELDTERRGRMKAEEMLWSNLTVMQDLLDRKSERERAEAQNLAQIQNRNELTRSLLAFAPVVVSHFMKGDKSGASNMRDMAVKGLLKGLSEAELTRIAGGLSPQNQLLFFELFKSYAEEEKKEQESRPALLRDVAPPEEEKPPTH